MADDKYRSFQDLAASERLGEDYAIESRSRPESGVAIIAPHGGTIEPFTDEIANGIAGADFSFYCFRALKKSSGLHIKSHLFDEPVCVQLVAAHRRVISIHGWGAEGAQVCVGGRDTELIAHFKKALAVEGINLERAHGPLSGTDQQNIVNRGATGCGVQFEMSMEFRKSMPVVRIFTSVIRQVLLDAKSHIN